MGGGGSAGRAAAGLLRISNTVSAMVTNQRTLERVETRIMLAVAIVLVVLGVLVAIFPRLVAYPSQRSRSGSPEPCSIDAIACGKRSRLSPMESLDAFIHAYGSAALFGAMVIEQFVPPLAGEPILLGAGL